MTKRSDLLSVILPAYNAESTILQAVDSVLSQTDVELELIVVNDGSTDSTLEVLSALSDPRLTIISGSNTGPAAARNRGIKRARGDLIAFIDADDIWLPGKVANQLTTLDAQPSAALAYGWTDHIDESGRHICPDRRVTLEGDLYREILTHNFIDTVSVVMVRKSALAEVGGFDETLPVVEDWDLYIRLAARHPFICVPTVLAQYRRLPTSLTTEVLTMEATSKRVIDHAFAAAPAPLQHLKRQSTARFYEYLATKASQGVPSRDNGLTAIRFFWTSARMWPANVTALWRRPWVLKGLATVLLWSVSPRARQTRTNVGCSKP